MTLAEKVEAPLAEGATRLQDLGEDGDLEGRDLEDLECTRAWREPVAAWKAAAEKAGEERLGSFEGPEPREPEPEEPLPPDPELRRARGSPAVAGESA
jgi:hypothetical protein